MKWFRTLRSRWGFKPEGFDADLFATACAGAMVMTFACVAIVAAAVTRQWSGVILGFLAGWFSRSHVDQS